MSPSSQPFSKTNSRQSISCRACVLARLKCDKTRPECGLYAKRNTHCHYLTADSGDIGVSEQTNRHSTRVEKRRRLDPSPIFMEDEPSDSGTQFNTANRGAKKRRIDTRLAVLEDETTSSDEPDDNAGPEQKELKLDRPLVVLNLQTTGLGVTSVRIVEIACVKISSDSQPETDRETLIFRINPGCNIPTAATAIHGIRDSDVKDCPTFAAVAHELNDFLDGCDISGFNVEIFHLPVLKREFADADITFPAEGAAVRVVDSYRIFKQNLRHNLHSALRYYCNGKGRDAFSAEAKAHAAADVLLAQVRMHHQLPADVPSLSDATSPNSKSPRKPPRLPSNEPSSLQNDDDPKTPKQPSKHSQRDAFSHLSGAQSRLAPSNTASPKSPTKPRAKRHEYVEPTGRIIWRDDEAVFNFGQYQNPPWTLREVAKVNPDYFRWMRNKFEDQELVKLANDALRGKFPSRSVDGAMETPGQVNM